MSLFSSLPDEIILIIFSFINDYNDIKSIIGTSKKFKNLIECYHLVYFFPIDVEDSYFDGKYLLKLYGISDKGHNVLVNIHNYKPYFDILLDNVNSLSNIYKIYKYEKFEIVESLPLIGYNEKNLKFLCLYFENNQKRKQIIDLVRKNNFKTFSDDLTFHYRKVTRENFLNLTSWNEISGNYRHQYKCKDTEMDIYDIDINNIRLSKKQFDTDLITILTFDIETSSTRGLGHLPKPEYDEDEIFMIGMTLHYKNENIPIKKICICTQECESEEDWKLYVCGNQTKLILLFASIISKLKPNFIVGFHDSVYDWPFIIEKAKKLNIYKKFAEILLLRNFQLENQIQFYERKTEIKITANESIESTIFKIPGIICIDVRIALRKIFDRTERSSLKYFLEKMGLEEKIDLPPNKIWKYYQDSKNNVIIDGMNEYESKQIHKENIKLIAKYCINDAWSCQRLMVKQSIIDSYIEMARLSYISLYDSYAYGNGIRVKNLLGYYSIKKNILYSMISNNEKNDVKYPGAYVFDPQTGLNNKRPVSCLDLNSLYPSIIMTYNISPEKIIFKHDISKYKNRKDLHKIEFEFNNEKIEAWTVRHNNQQHKKGIYVILLEELFTQRLKLKKQLSELEKDSFEYNKLNLKQNAIKVYMNSFYGETGNRISPLFLVQLAGGVTSIGQKIIKSISKFIKEKKCDMVYGDTDSSFFTNDDKEYELIDLLYNNNEITKQQYWTEMVNKSIQVTENIKNEINEYLVQYSGSNYLKMGFDGVLFPSQFLDKKKYIGKLHTKNLKFENTEVEKQYWINSKPYVKGVDIVKKGQSGFFKNIGNQIVNNLLSIENENTNIQLIENIIKQNIIEADNIDIDNFTITATWKPMVQNLSVQNFIKRMKINGIQIPEIGERFDYVVTKGIKGKCKGDLMEFVETYQNNKEMKIDMRYYFKSIVSICSSFIVDELFEIGYKNRKKESEKYIEKIIDRVCENKSSDIKKYLSNPSIKEKSLVVLKKYNNNNINNLKQPKINSFFKTIINTN